ncbi:hypothetical protein DYB32_005786 [Aphanomyces invadans]|uniref:Uncharacterized protein n=1 Tax=Aphanomyces invadans TaxID=157072 RepID=A0A3R6Z2Q1_9STRA|nr:hypothetical protein DYB32_005786 [Aphanomyces invadans]
MLHPTDPQDVQIHVLMVLANALTLYYAGNSLQAAKEFTQTGACKVLMQCLSSGVEDLELQAIRTMFYLCKSTGTTGQVGGSMAFCLVVHAASSDASIPVKVDGTKCLHVYVAGNTECRDEVVGHNGLSIVTQVLLLLATNPDADLDVGFDTLVVCLQSEFIQQYPIERALVGPLFDALQPHFQSQPSSLVLMAALVTDHLRYATVCATHANVIEALVHCLGQRDQTVAKSALKVLQTMCPIGQCDPSVVHALAAANALVVVMQWLSTFAAGASDIVIQEGLLTIVIAFCTVEYAGAVVGHQGISVLLSMFTYQPALLELTCQALSQLALASPAVLNEIIPFGAGQGFENILVDLHSSSSCKKSALVFFSLMGEHSSDIILSRRGAKALFQLATDSSLQKLALAAVDNLTGYNRMSHRLELQAHVVEELYTSVLHPILAHGSTDRDVLSAALKIVHNASHLPSLLDQSVLTAVLACIQRHDLPILTWDVVLQCLQCAATTAWNNVSTIQGIYEHIFSTLVDQPDSSVAMTVLRCVEVGLAHPTWKVVFVGCALHRQQAFIDFCEALAERLDRAFSAVPAELVTILSVVSALCGIRRLTSLLLQGELHVSVLRGLKARDAVDVVLSCLQAFLPHAAFQNTVLGDLPSFHRLVQLYSQDNMAAAQILCALSQNSQQFPVSSALVTTLLYQVEFAATASKTMSERILSNLTDGHTYKEQPIWSHIVETRNLRILNEIMALTTQPHVLVAAIGCGQLIVDAASPESSSFRNSLLRLLVSSSQVQVRSMCVEALATMVRVNRDVVASDAIEFFDPPTARAILSALPSHPLAVAALVQFAIEMHWDLAPFWQQVTAYRMRHKFVELLSNAPPTEQSGAMALTAFMRSAKVLKTREVNSLMHVATRVPDQIKATTDRANLTVWLNLMLEMSAVSRLAQALIDGNGVECMMESLGQHDACQSILINLLHNKSATERLLNGHGVARLLSLVDSNKANSTVLLELLGILNAIAHKEKAFRVAMSGSLKLFSQLLEQSIQLPSIHEYSVLDSSSSALSSSVYDVAVASPVVQVLVSLCELHEIRVQVVLVPEIFAELYMLLQHAAVSDDIPEQLTIDSLKLIQYRVIGSNGGGATITHDDMHVLLDIVVGLAQRQDSLPVHLHVMETLHALWCAAPATPFYEDNRWRLAMDHLSSMLLAAYPKGAPSDVQALLLPLAADLGRHRTVVFPSELLQWLVLSSFDANNSLVYPLLVQLCCTSPSFHLFLKSHSRIVAGLRTSVHPLARRVYVLLGQDVVATTDNDDSASHQGDDEDEVDEGKPDTTVGFVEDSVACPRGLDAPTVDDDLDQALLNLPPNTTTTGVPDPIAPVSSAPYLTHENNELHRSSRGASQSTPNDSTRYGPSDAWSAPAATTTHDEPVTCHHCSGIVPVPAEVMAYLDLVPCPHCQLPLGFGPAAASNASTKTVSCFKCYRPLHLPEGLDLPDVKCPFCNTVNVYAITFVLR